jgi:hypothetical protein
MVFSDVLKNSNFRIDHNSGAPGGLESADRPTLPRATLLYAMPWGLSAEMTRSARERDFRGGSISEFFNIG